MVSSNPSVVRTTADSRDRFSWANGLFGQMILELEADKPDLLTRSYQPRFKESPR